MLNEQQSDGVAQDLCPVAEGVGAVKKEIKPKAWVSKVVSDYKFEQPRVKISFVAFEQIDEAVANGLIPSELGEELTKLFSLTCRLHHSRNEIIGQVDLWWDGMESWQENWGICVQIVVPSWAIMKRSTSKGG
ncbi:MAG: hypothetical protein NTZ18_00660 [Candidatus Komeilibacteria bacterium]|nr:hypothetical protein [Candidatus Komeilibacteria bacterium]